jgi:hypothetical protein
MALVRTKQSGPVQSTQYQRNRLRTWMPWPPASDGPAFTAMFGVMGYRFNERSRSHAPRATRTRQKLQPFFGFPAAAFAAAAGLS